MKESKTNNVERSFDQSVIITNKTDYKNPIHNIELLENDEFKLQGVKSISFELKTEKPKE